MAKWKCPICGMEDNDSKPPLEHGRMGMAVYPNPIPQKKCPGKFQRIE